PDASLYDSIKKNLESIESDLIWHDPEASTVFSDESSLVQNLKIRQKRHFLELREKMKCELPREIISKCEEFINNFRREHMPNNFRNT
ncbi:4171_t:CDS:2, partial [Funneliformis mosseae]